MCSSTQPTYVYSGFDPTFGKNDHMTPACAHKAHKVKGNCNLVFVLFMHTILNSTYLYCKECSYPLG